MRRFVVVILWCMVVAACGADDDTALRDVRSASPALTTTTLPAVQPPAPSTTMSPPAAEGPAPPTTTTTTLADSEPAADTTLIVTVPTAGSRVHDRHCVFEGTAEPGADLVAAGRYPVDVAGDGTWRTTLVLNPGGNVARLTATDAAGRTTEARVPVYYDPPLELRADGIGDHDLFEPMTGLMTSLVDALGEPDRDEVVTAADAPEGFGDRSSFAVFSLTGYPAHEYARFVAWDAAGLTVMFSDHRPGNEEGPGPVVLNGWQAHDSGEFGARLMTGEGIGPGSLLADAERAYAGSLICGDEPDDLDGHWHFLIATSAPSFWSDETMNFYGILDGDPAGGGARIDLIQAGFGFDTC